MLQFTAIDFETANTYANSACSLAAVSITGTEIHERYTLIKPPFPTFAAENIRIHGITPEMVAHKAKFNVLWPAIKNAWTDVSSSPIMQSSTRASCAV